jgi:hypothetical protein
MTDESSRRAQAWSEYKSTEIAFLLEPKLEVGVGLVEEVLPPLPSRPDAPRPQHETLPSSKTAHEKSRPDEIWTAERLLPKSPTKLGEVLITLVSLVRYCSPQQDTDPLSSKAQV